MNIGTVFYNVTITSCLATIAFLFYLNYKSNRETTKEFSKIIISLKDKSKEYNVITEMEKALDSPKPSIKKPKKPVSKIDMSKRVL